MPIDLAKPIFTTLQNLLVQLSSITLDPRDLRPFLGALYLTVASDKELSTELEQISEHDIVQAVMAWDNKITGSTAVWSYQPEDPKYLLHLFSLVRSLDGLCQVYARAFVDDPGTWRDEQSQTFIIPRQRARQKLSPRGQGTRRRLLKHHRILPISIGNRTVEVHSLANRAKPSATLPRTAGAAMFDGLQLLPPIVGESFIFTSIVGNNLTAEIDRQVASAVAEETFVLAWPELSVDSNHREYIREKLKKVSGAGAHTMPQLVVAGSCHEQIGAWWYNRAAVFDGYGQYEYHYCKFSPYIRHVDGCIEAIQPGGTIPIFVTDDFVMSVAICRDLADFNQTDVFGALEVDLIVVPSMGGSSTMDSHEAAAMQLKALNDTRVFVVQVNEAVNSAKPIGWVLPGGAIPIRSRVSQFTPWVSYEVDIR
jgi:predicted amidohydrolase